MGRFQQLLLILFVHLVAPSIAIPANVELDLIFPRANRTYKPVWPFPVVFGIRNVSQLWYNDQDVLEFLFSWNLYGYNDTATRNIGQSLRGTQFGSAWWDTFKQQREIGRPSDGLFLHVYVARRDMVNATERHFRLTYATELRRTCTRNYDLNYNPKTVFSEDFIDFSTDPDAAEFPDILSGGPCPTYATNFEVADSRRDLTGMVCPVMAPEVPSPNPCGLKVDETIAARAKEEILEMAGCPNGTWPDPEGKLSRFFCNANQGTAQTAVYPVMMAFLSAIAMLWAIV
ncbi:hypothetical protein DL763_002868 [Monosporascus cannonballus]|nr:hypothetical protein DL763_002868 [Monosporascus cannonballus]